ncbi:hypothetical protein NB836_024970, partial [Pseudomonas aeruginosa]|nr:hypothetical protein [Pseudomonas aeruginosa]
LLLRLAERIEAHGEQLAQLETLNNGKSINLSRSRRPSGLRKTIKTSNSLAHRTTWLRSDFCCCDWRNGSRRMASNWRSWKP